MDEYNRGVVTNLVLLEILDVLRSIYSRDFKKLRKIKNYDKCLSHVIEYSTKLYQEILGLTVNSAQFMIIPSQLDMYKLLESSLTVLNSTNGKIRFYNKCSKCNTQKDYKYFSSLRCVSTVDIMHILLSKEIGCNQFVTFDQGFEEIVSHELVKPVIIRVLK